MQNHRIKNKVDNQKQNGGSDETVICKQQDGQLVVPFKDS